MCCCCWVKVSDLCRLSSPKHTVSIFLLSESMWQCVFVFTDLFDQGGYVEPEVICVCVWGCVCACACLMSAELERRHQVKLCLLSPWDRIVDSPWQRTLVINQALHQEEVWVKKAHSESLFPHSATYVITSDSHPKKITLNIQSPKNGKY